MLFSYKAANKAFAIVFFAFALLATSTLFAPSAFAVDYTLTYNANITQHQTGVISSGSVPNSAVYVENTTVTVSSNSGNLSRQGFAFAGWNTSANGSGTNYTAGSGTFSIVANTTLYAKWTIPISARLIGSTGTIFTFTNPNGYTNYTNICSSGLSGITSDGTFVYFRSSLAAGVSVICKFNSDGTFVSSNPVASAGGAPALSSIDVNNRDLTFSSGCIWLRFTGDTADSALYCISIADWTMRPIATPSGKGMFAGAVWLTGNLIDFPDGRIGAVSAGSTTLGQAGTSFGGANGTTTITCPAAMYCKVLRLYKPSGTGASVSLAFSEDIVLADDGKDGTAGWPNDDHGIATDGTYLYQIKYNNGYKVWALARGAPSYMVFNGAGTGACGAGTGISNTQCPINNPMVGSSGAMSNSTYFGHNHLTNQYIIGDYQSSKFYISGSYAPPAGPGSATGLSNLTISAGTLTPAFNSSVSTYADTITATSSSITVTPTALDAGVATIMVKANSGTYASVTSGTASAALTMSTGINTVYIQVTGSDGSTAVTTITVFRPENPTITLTPSFLNTTKTYLDTLTVSISTSVYSPTGTFLFTENGTAISGCSAVAISTGTARCNWTPTTTGSRTVVATYSGDNNIGLKSDTQTVTVNDVVSITSSSATISRKYGSARTTHTVTYSGGSDTRTVSATSLSLASGMITFDTATALFTFDTRTAVGTYYDTITVTDVRGSSASYMQAITVTVADTLTVTSDTSTVTYTGIAANVNPAMSAVSGLVSGDVISGATYTYTNSGGSSYGPSTTKPTNTGTYVITPSAMTFSSGATSNYVAVTYRTSTLTISKAAQATLITTPLYNVFNGNPTSATLYTTGGTDTGTVSYAYVALGSTASGCALSGLNSSIVTVTSAGTCRIVATKATSSNYLAAVSDTATVTFHPYVTNIPGPRAAEFPVEIVLSSAPARTNNGIAPTINYTGVDITKSPGVTFTISGSGFIGTRLVKVSGINAVFTVLSDTSLQITMPTGLIEISGPIYVEKAEGFRSSEDWVTGTA